MKKKNVLFITTDHLRHDTTGFGGDPIILTPAMDDLAASGAVFENYFVQNPVCQPSRATILTGRYPRHHGVKWNGSGLNENEVPMTEIFRNNGYATASIGKHHINQKRFEESLDYMTASGLRRNWTKHEDGDYTVQDPNEFEQYVLDRGFEYKTGYALDNFVENLGAIPSDLPEDCHLDSFTGMKCLEYLQEYRSDKPFFIWLGFYGPHHPYVPSGRFAHLYDPENIPGFHRAEDDINKKPEDYSCYSHLEDHKFSGFTKASDETFKKMKAAYYGMVSQIDYQIGLVTDLLKRKGLYESTIIVLTSDHGEFLGDHGIPAKAPFLLDCMLKVPCIISAPSNRQGHKIDSLVESVDLFPTLLDLCGIESPSYLQGMSMAEFIRANRSGEERSAVYAEAGDIKSVRTKDWKYIHYPNRDTGELYHLSKDIHELNNLFHEEPDKVNEMRELYFEIMDKTEESAHSSYQLFTFEDKNSKKTVSHFHTW